MTALIVLEGVVIALLVVLVIGLLRSHAEVLRQLHELGAGRAEPATADGEDPVRGRTAAGVPEPRAQPATTLAGAHDIVGQTPDGAAVSVGVVGAGHTTLLAFLTSGCGTCQAHWQAFSSGRARDLPGRQTRLVVVTRGPDRESPAAVAAIAPADHTTVMSSAAWDDYSVPASPYFILVDGPSGRVVGEGAATDWDRVLTLLRESVADAVPPDATAGAEPSAGPRPSGRDRAARVARDLAAAGIEPGHASLYPGATGDGSPTTGTGQG